MPRFKNLLVGVDLSHGDWMTDAANETPSELATQQAIRLAKAAGARVHFISALDLHASTQRLLRESAGGEENVLSQGRIALDRLVARAAAEGVTAEASVVIGKAWEAIVRLAKNDKSDLVIVGSRRHTRLGEMLLGSTNLHVLGEAPSPVWIVKPGHGEFDKILVATDFSAVCGELLAGADELASLMGAELHVVHVVESREKGFWPFARGQSASEEARDAALREAEAKLSEATAGLAVMPQLHLREGGVVEILLELTESLEIDLLAMGMVAWGGVQGRFMGSTAHAIMSRLACSLLSQRDTKST
jgi:universal stress protein E